MHVGMVTINGEKMSKSLGNTKSIDHVLKNWGPNIIRLFCLAGHYSKPIDYSEEILKETIIKWRQVENSYAELSSPEKDESVRPSSFSEFFTKKVDFIKKEFNDALNSDFNTPLAFNAFFRLVKEVNNFAASEDISQSIAKNIVPTFETMLEILGLRISKISDEERNTINELIKKRNGFREQKQYQKADKIRKQISDMGIVLIDHKNKTLLLKQEKISTQS